jgi:hypothetical protein
MGERTYREKFGIATESASFDSAKDLRVRWGRTKLFGNKSGCSMVIVTTIAVLSALHGGGPNG